MSIRERLHNAAVAQMVQRTSDKTGSDISKSEIYMAEINDAADGLLDALLPELDTLQSDWLTLLRYAKGEQEHRFRGSCPDARIGDEGYDPGCLVCQAIVRIEALEDRHDHAI